VYTVSSLHAFNKPSCVTRKRLERGGSYWQRLLSFFGFIRRYTHSPRLSLLFHTIYCTGPLVFRPVHKFPTASSASAVSSRGLFVLLPVHRFPTASSASAVTSRGAGGCLCFVLTRGYRLPRRPRLFRREGCWCSVQSTGCLLPRRLRQPLLWEQRRRCLYMVSVLFAGKNEKWSCLTRVRDRSGEGKSRTREEHESG
jgi:hypothetical protein